MVPLATKQAEQDEDADGAKITGKTKKVSHQCPPYTVHFSLKLTFVLYN